MTPEPTLWKRCGRWMRARPAWVLFMLVVVLLLIIMAQNWEPTSIDLLFWTLVEVPKLLLILGAMLIGAVLWEVLRRLLLRRRNAKPWRPPY